MGVQVVMDGVDVTALTLEGSVTHQHNRTSFCLIRQPAALTTGTSTSRLKIYLDGVLDFHGMCLYYEDQGDEDTMYTAYTFADPTYLFDFRPARDGIGSGDRGDFSKPSFMARRQTAPQMLKEILDQSLDGSNPADGEGSMGIALGTFATGGANLSGAPADWPMSIGKVIALLTETGELDVVARPIDIGGNMVEVSAYNGDYGSNLSGSVRFDYRTGSYNATGCRRSVDTREMVNKLWIYGGPRVGTKADPQGDQHWAFNVTGDDPGLQNFPGWAAVLAAIELSRADYYQRMMIRIFDADEAIALRELYRYWWLMESWLRSRPKVMVAITPEPGIKPAFRTGDKIHVAAGIDFHGGFSGIQRVMEYTYRFDENGRFELGEPVGRPGVPAVHATDWAEKPA